jgi:pyrophosphatase PpaX
VIENPAITPELAARLNAVRAVLFDLDGTLLDTIPLILTSFRHATATVLGAPLPDDVMLANVGVPLRVQMTEFSPEHAEELLHCYREHNNSIHDEMVCMFPPTPAALTRIADTGLPLGIVTSKSRMMAERGLAITGIAGLFQTLVTCDDLAEHKPDPAPLRFAADALGVDVRYCIYIGDSPHDVAAARAAGMLAVAATWGVSSRETLLAAEPDLILDSLDGFAEVIADTR